MILSSERLASKGLYVRDRCGLSMASAQHLTLGVNVFGPAFVRVASFCSAFLLPHFLVAIGPLDGRRMLLLFLLAVLWKFIRRLTCFAAPRFVTVQNVASSEINYPLP